MFGMFRALVNAVNGSLWTCLEHGIFAMNGMTYYLFVRGNQPVKIREDVFVYAAKS